jgi:hypothetical protein
MARAGQLLRPEGLPLHSWRRAEHVIACRTVFEADVIMDFERAPLRVF